MTVPTAVFVLLLLWALLAPSLGILFGAWLWHRARSGEGPLPSITSSGEQPPELIEPPRSRV